MNKKGDILKIIFNTLKDGVIGMVDLERAILSAGYGATMGKIDYEYEKIQDKRHLKEVIEERKRKVRKYLWKLKNDGIISEKNDKIKITPKGIKKLKYSNITNYEKEKSENFIIVSFDIPNQYTHERNEFRNILILLDFEMIHRSTWIGKNKIPQNLINYLDKREILEYVKIFEVTKIGMLGK